MNYFVLIELKSKRCTLLGFNEKLKESEDKSVFGGFSKIKSHFQIFLFVHPYLLNVLIK